MSVDDQVVVVQHKANDQPLTLADRMLVLQRKVNEAGILDVKFCKVRGASTDQLKVDVVTALEAYFDGKYHPLPPCGDSQRV